MSHGKAARLWLSDCVAFNAHLCKIFAYKLFLKNVQCASASVYVNSNWKQLAQLNKPHTIQHNSKQLKVTNFICRSEPMSQEPQFPNSSVPMLPSTHIPCSPVPMSQDVLVVQPPSPSIVIVHVSAVSQRHHHRHP